MTCPHSADCIFYSTVEPDVFKRIKFAGSFPYCKGGQHAACAILEVMDTGRPVPDNLLPNGGLGDYLDFATMEHTFASARRQFVVVEDSPVFMRIAGNIVRNAVPDALVVECNNFEEACTALGDGETVLVVSGYGIGSGRSARDLRHHTTAPIIVLTSHPENTIDAPVNSRVVQKASGPGALTEAIHAMVGA